MVETSGQTASRFQAILLEDIKYGLGFTILNTDWDNQFFRFLGPMNELAFVFGKIVEESDFKRWQQTHQNIRKLPPGQFKAAKERVKFLCRQNDEFRDDLRFDKLRGFHAMEQTAEESQRLVGAYPQFSWNNFGNPQIWQQRLLARKTAFSAKSALVEIQNFRHGSKLYFLNCFVDEKDEPLTIVKLQMLSTLLKL